MSFPNHFKAQQQTRHPGFEYEMQPLPIFDDKTTLPNGSLLQEQVAIITGGDSGIGRAVAVAYAKQGADVAIVYYNEDKDAEDTQKAVEAYGQSCLLIKGDLTEETFATDVVTKVMDTYKHIDILVNNAAVQYENSSLQAITTEQFDKTFKTNVYGTFYMTKAVLPHLKSGACIINTTSVVAFHGHEKLIDYSMTKGAITAFTRSLSMALTKSKSGIRVNAVAPGPIWTPFIPSSFDVSSIPAFGTTTPLGRAGQPIECAGAYVFLASKAASYITGQTIHINGGEIING
ncbi:SDR family oxidoreductase [Cellulosilyticum lentocellum]|uniref:3-oxoacyl-(Acyl-carrier-protein) reductase n=1 Tax=Cellulosilyticum lentocellum (strain ATCC 49066 / DSM 5427 / NCIMB 11756 / RHM5) TaxID=642492 RepID=F2JN89_CELLD|nr:SDR family oxidoreductase [Cellulosilyticum lentocellum]ADZ83543.1 3-oxoacyl-(acyl-carrier-protein) reductase [Cellulosilyticum lentocellum DSM 5427]